MFIIMLSMVVVKSMGHEYFLCLSEVEGRCKEEMIERKAHKMVNEKQFMIFCLIFKACNCLEKFGQ